MAINYKQHMWKIITGAVTLFGMIAAVWGVEDRYANKEVVMLGMNNLQKQQESFQNTQRTFRESQVLTIQQQRVNYLKTRLEFYQQMLEQVRYDKSMIINQLHSNPNNTYLKERKAELDRRETVLRRRIDGVMSGMERLQ